MTGPPEPLRFIDILTTASAVANYLGEGTVGPHHLLHAVAILREETTIEALGRPVSPLVPRPGRAVDARVRDLVQRWFASLGSDGNATIGGEALDRFLDDVRALSES
jgi:hypothetical protein